MNQLELFNEVLEKTSIVIVTCPHCGQVLLIKSSNTEPTCPHCHKQEDACNFPDFFYEGWDEQ